MSMTTNKQALRDDMRERFERWWELNYHNDNPPRFGWERWRDGDGYKVDDDESELDGMWESWQAAHSSKLEAAEKRIAEKRTITVKLPADYHHADGSLNTDMVNTCAVVGAFRDALAAAGITVKGE